MKEAAETVKRGRGRPKGSKNRKTLEKEAQQQQQEQEQEQEQQQETNEAPANDAESQPGGEVVKDETPQEGHEKKPLNHPGGPPSPKQRLIDVNTLISEPVDQGSGPNGSEIIEPTPAKRRRGRPKGSKNKTTEQQTQEEQKPPAGNQGLMIPILADTLIIILGKFQLTDGKPLTKEESKHIADSFNQAYPEGAPMSPKTAFWLSFALVIAGRINYNKILKK